MPSPTPNPRRPSAPESSHQNEEGDLAEFEPETQPGDEDGVTEDMASLAFNPTHPSHLPDVFDPTLLEKLEAAEKLHLQGDFDQMDDAAIMLELRAGNMAGFDFLIQKY